MRDTNQRPQVSYGIRAPGHRLPDATRIGLVRLLVSDLPRSVAFYERVLGLRPLALDHDRVSLAAHDERPLLELRTRRGVTPAQRGAFGLYHFAILLPDRAALGRFAAHVASLRIRVGTADHLVSESLYLSDTDGLGIEVYADRPRHAWNTSGRELAMATDPLDIESVIAAGAGVIWDGAPAGTAMGHVHLHVGSLDAAEAFYHRALGFDKTVWSYPGALFMSASAYHHHLGTDVWSPGPAPGVDNAQLLEWELVVPSRDDVEALGRRLLAAGNPAAFTESGLTTADPWQTRIRVISER